MKLKKNTEYLPQKTFKAKKYVFRVEGTAGVNY